MWIRPLFAIIPFNSIHFHQIGKFGIIFDTRPCEINDLAVPYRQNLNCWFTFSLLSKAIELPQILHHHIVQSSTQIPCMSKFAFRAVNWVKMTIDSISSQKLQWQIRKAAEHASKVVTANQRSVHPVSWRRSSHFNTLYCIDQSKKFILFFHWSMQDPF